jgi:hypothetical protein
MELGIISEIRSGSLHDRDGRDAYYVLVGDISARGLRTESLSEGASPSKSGVAASLSEGDIVVALRGTNNAAATVPHLGIFDRPIFATLDVAIIRTDRELLPPYLTWYLNLPETQATLSFDRSGSAAPRLPLSALKALKVPLPSLDRQAMIASAAAEARRERALINQIEQSRQRLYEELLRRAAGEGPVPGGNPTRTDHHLPDRGATMKALSNPHDWKQ